MIELFPDQSALVPSLRDALRRVRCALLVAPCGFGKTVLFSWMAAEVAKREKRILILVHRDFLVDQVVAALESWGVRPGVIAAGRGSLPHRTVQVASVWTLIRRLDKAGHFNFIIADEAHHCADGNSWERVLLAFPQAKVLGVTATPWRSSGRGLGAVFETLVMGPSVADLMESGRLSRYQAYAPTNLDLSGVKTTAGDYQNDQLAEAVDQPKIVGSAVSHYQKLCPGKRAVAFAVNVLHSQHIRDQFLAAGISCEHIDGTTPGDDRRRVIRRFTRGETLVLTNVGIVSEGFDIPAVEAALLLRPTQSLALHIQMCGRALRAAPGKAIATILDHAGNTARHGLPDDDREWSLGDAPTRKRAAGEISVRICPACFAAVRPTVRRCECGHQFVVETEIPEHAEGELAPVDLDAVRFERRREQGLASDLDALLAIERRNGYRSGWARHVWAARNDKRQAQAMRSVR